MIDFEKDKNDKEHYYKVEIVLRALFNIRIELIESFNDKYYKNIVELEKKSQLIRSLNNLTLQLLSKQIKHEYISSADIKSELKLIKRLSDESNPSTKISEMINSLSIK